MLYDIFYQFLYYENDQNYALKGFGLAYPDLDNKLLQYHKSVGYDAYKASSADPHKSVMWRLNGSWHYTA